MFLGREDLSYLPSMKENGEMSCRMVCSLCLVLQGNERANSGAVVLLNVMYYNAVVEFGATRLRILLVTFTFCKVNVLL